MKEWVVQYLDATDIKGVNKEIIHGKLGGLQKAHGKIEIKGLFLYKKF